MCYSKELERIHKIIDSFRAKMLEKYNVGDQIRIPESKVMHELYEEFGEPRLCMDDHDTSLDRFPWLDSDLKFTDDDISCASVFAYDEIIPEKYYKE